MKIQRYQDFDDVICFEDKDDDLDNLLGKDSLSSNFKNFLRQRKV